MDWITDDTEETEETERIEANEVMSHQYDTTIPLLSAAEEVTLCRAAQSGDLDARNYMVEANIRLVMSIAHRFKGRSMEHEDMVQEGIPGLIQAIQRFDCTRGIRFSTYATYWIRQAITRSIEKHDRLIRLPTHAIGAEPKVKRAEEKILATRGRPATIDELSEETGLSNNLIRGLLFFGPEPLSLDYSGEEGDGMFIEVIPDENTTCPERDTMRSVIGNDLREAIGRLDPREQIVIERRFGLGTNHDWTLREISEELKISREGVRHIETRALKKLRFILKDHPNFVNASSSCPWTT